MEQKKIIDVTGVELTPGEPSRCKGNGKDDPMSCCCDECDHFLACFPEWDENGLRFRELTEDDVDRLLREGAALLNKEMIEEFLAAGKKPLPPGASFKTFEELLEHIENRKKEKENGC